MNRDGSGILLTVGEAAAKLHVSTRTVWRMVADGELKMIHIRGCARVYLRSVEEYLKQSDQAVCV